MTVLAGKVTAIRGSGVAVVDSNGEKGGARNQEPELDWSFLSFE
jgi:hypothetical protein